MVPDGWLTRSRVPEVAESTTSWHHTAGCTLCYHKQSGNSFVRFLVPCTRACGHLACSIPSIVIAIVKLWQCGPNPGVGAPPAVNRLAQATIITRCCHLPSCCRPALTTYLRYPSPSHSPSCTHRFLPDSILCLSYLCTLLSASSNSFLPYVVVTCHSRASAYRSSVSRLCRHHSRSSPRWHPTPARMLLHPV